MNQNSEWEENDPDAATSDKWRKDPENWIYGIFYFNKADKRLFVSKKIECMGITLNFANRKSMVTYTVALVFFGLIIFLVTNKK